jgi:transcriptional regulator with XRE-family HTH domain
MDLLALQLRKKRMEKGLQAKDMAHALKIKPSSYSRIENGQTKMSVSMAKKIVEILQMPLGELFLEKLNPSDSHKNSDSTFLIDNSALFIQNEKLLESVLKLVEQVSKTNEQQIMLMQNQNDIFKEFSKLRKAI